MNPNFSTHLNPTDQMLPMTQTGHGQRQLQYFPVGFPYQPNNFLGLQRLLPGGFVGSQAMSQMQPQRQQPGALSIPQFSPLPPLNFTYSSPGFYSHPAPPMHHPEDVASVNSFSHDDEYILACAVNEGKGEGLEEILRPLDRVNGHSTKQWIAHYVENYKNISRKIQQCHTDVSLPNSPISRAPSCVPSSKLQRAHKKRDDGRQIHTKRSSNAKTISLGINRSHQAAGRYESRSPTPPLAVASVHGRKGSNKFTEEDAAYFRKILPRIFKEKGPISVRMISREMEKRAPNHPRGSWRDYIHTQKTIVQDIRHKVLDTVIPSYDSTSGESELEDRAEGQRKKSSDNDIEYNEDLSDYIVVSPVPVSFSPRPRVTKKYTREDAAIFRKVLTSMFKHSRGRQVPLRQISLKLVKQAPDHPFSSWEWYVGKNKDVIEEVRREVRGSLRPSSDPTSRGNSEGGVEGQTHDPDRFEDEDDNNVSLSSSESEGETRVRDESYLKMRGGLSAYIPSERRALAKYIANITLERWDNTRHSWAGFQSEYDRHTIKDWMRWYKHPQNNAEIKRMVRRFEIRNARRKVAGRKAMTVPQSLNPNQPTSFSNGLHEEAGLPEPVKWESDAE